jgi:hypothetical protein
LVEVQRLSTNFPDFENPPPGVTDMADDAASEADRPEQEREYQQFQAEQARQRGGQVERLSFRERWRSRLHGWVDGGP